jgi:hypothetical protein
MTRKEIIRALLESPLFLDMNAWEKRDAILAAEQASIRWIAFFKES